MFECRRDIASRLGPGDMPSPAGRAQVDAYAKAAADALARLSPAGRGHSTGPWVANLVEALALR